MFAPRLATRRVLAPTPASASPARRALASAAAGVSAPLPDTAAAAPAAPAAAAAASSASDIYSGPGPWADSALPTAPAARPLNRYIVIAEDFSDKGALARRIEVRERHLEHARRGKLAGRIELGGALLRRDFSEIDDNEPALYSMGGSVMIVRGEDIEDVRQRVSQDEYILNGVWDITKLRIYPLVQAMESTLTQIKVPPPPPRPEPTRAQVQAAAEASVKAAAAEQQQQQHEGAAAARDVEASLGELREQQQQLRNARSKMTLSALRKTAQAQAAERAAAAAPSA